MKKTPYIVAVAGGSGSGKTTFAKNLRDFLGKDNCIIILQDSYYFDQSHKFDGDGGAVNFDHPDSIDFALLATHISILQNGGDVDIPLYDFSTHKRLQKTEKLSSHPIILVDGILILTDEKLRSLFNESLFLDVPEAIRFQRRLKRDVEERGRTPDGVKVQFEKQVKPMHDLFVEPSKKFATKIINNNIYEDELRSIQCRLKDRLI